MSAVVYICTHDTFWGLTDFDGVRLRLWTATTNGHVVHSPDDTNLEGEGGMMMPGENRRTEENPVPGPLCTSQIPHGMTRPRTRFSAVRGLRLTAWAMARQYLRFGSTLPSVRHYANRLSLDFSFETREIERYRTQNPVKSKLPSYSARPVSQSLCTPPWCSHVVLLSGMSRYRRDYLICLSRCTRIRRFVNLKFQIMHS
jgi:hypothetical protein